MTTHTDRNGKPLDFISDFAERCRLRRLDQAVAYRRAADAAAKAEAKAAAKAAKAKGR